jgi:FkbM family methyltransferase
LNDLERIEIALPGGQRRPFYFRSTSDADKAVINQVFTAREYKTASDVLQWRMQGYISGVGQGKSLLVIDAGAHIGASVVYFWHLYPRIHVCAIEPERENFQILRRNTDGLPVTLIEGAVNGATGKVWLQDPKIGQWGYRIDGGSGLYQVQGYTVKNLLERFPSEKFAPLMCKLDIEGSEGDVFGHDASILDVFPLVIVELHDWMLPGRNTSKSLLRAASERNVDFVIGGENVFILNNELLKLPAR